jgi:hypothetical protein
MADRDFVVRMLLEPMGVDQINRKLAAVNQGYQFAVQLKDLEHGTIARLTGLQMERVVTIQDSDWPSMNLVVVRGTPDSPINKVYTIKSESAWDMDWFAANLAKYEKTVKAVFLVEASVYWNSILFYERLGEKIDAISHLFHS